MNKRLRNIGLYVLAVITVIFIGTSVLDKPNAENATKTLRYSDFIEAVQDKEISRVLISPDNGTAQVVENDGSRSEVNLAPDKDLLKILTDNDVDIAVQPTKLSSPWQQAFSSLLFPKFIAGLPPPPEPLCALLNKKKSAPIKMIGNSKLLNACCHGLESLVG